MVPLASSSCSREALGVAAEEDVDAAPRHVGGDGDRAEAPCLGDHVGLPLVLLGVQHPVLDAPLLQQPRHLLGLLDRDGADQYRLAAAGPLGDVVGGSLELGRLALVDEVGLVEADHGAVRRDRHDLEPVGVGELPRLGGGGAGHAAELVVHAEVVLEGDRGEGLVLLLDLHPLLGLDRLVEAFRPSPALEDATGELVDDLDLAALYHVVDVALEQLLGAQRGLELVDEVLVDVLVEVVDAERLLDRFDAALGRHDGALRLVDLVVVVATQALHDRGELHVQLLRVVGASGDDQRRASLVDQDRVDLVDDGERVAALHLVFRRDRHVVAQVVEAELVVGAVRDAGRVGPPFRLVVVDVGDDGADLEPEEPVQLPHPLPRRAWPGSRSR